MAVVAEHLGRRACRTPGCRTRAGHGLTGLFCRRCAGRLAVWRRELQGRMDRRYRIYGTEGREWADED